MIEINVENVFYTNEDGLIFDDGIITNINKVNSNIVFIKDNVEEMEIDYYIKSGQKKISNINLVKHFTNYKEKISKIILNRYLNKWNKIYDALLIEYDILDNYNSIETESINNTTNLNKELNATNTNNVDKEISNTNNTTINKDLEVNNTESISNTLESNSTGNGTGDNSIYGFNSSTKKDISQNKNTGTSENISDSSSDIEKLQSEIETLINNNIDNGTENTISTNVNIENLDEIGNNNSNRTLTRKGNIGVTTSQQMLQSEIELRKTDFYKIVYEDIDNILTLKIY